VPPAADSRRRAAHLAAPFLFLAAVTLAVLLIRAGLESGSSRATSTPAVQTQTAPARTTTTTKHRAKPGGGRFYTVQAGDTFSSISVRTGVSIAELERLNPGVSSNALHVGQKLRVK
jgi:LysM repeat protein